MNIIEKLNEAYIKQGAQEAKDAEGWFPRASGIGGCLREMAHKAAGFEQRPNSPETMRVFELGHQRGAKLAEVAKSVWPDAEAELEVRIELPDYPVPMLGHLDVWIPSERTIIDFKTAGAFKMGLLNEGGKEGAGEDYELQLQAYRHGVFWGQMSGGILSSIRCLLIFEAKDSDARKGVEAGQLAEVEVPYTEELEARYRARLEALVSILKARDAKTLEPTSVQGMPDPSKHWRCRMKGGVSRYCSIGPILGKCSK